MGQIPGHKALEVVGDDRMSCDRSKQQPGRKTVKAGGAGRVGSIIMLLKLIYELHEICSLK